MPNRWAYDGTARHWEEHWRKLRDAEVATWPEREMIPPWRDTTMAQAAEERREGDRQAIMELEEKLAWSIHECELMELSFDTQCDICKQAKEIACEREQEAIQGRA